MQTGSVRDVVVTGDGGDPHLTHALFHRQVHRMGLIGVEGFAADEFRDEGDIVRTVAVQEIRTGFQAHHAFDLSLHAVEVFHKFRDFRLFPLLTAAENVMYPMELRGMKPAAAKKRAAELIRKVGLPETVLDRFPAMLSGGEQQRVAIARALGLETKVLLADEPTGNLDSGNSANIFSILQALAHEDGYCVVIVTHDEELGKQADETLRIQDGMLV